MAYVGGGYDATLVDLVARAGYRTARGIHEGFALDPSRRLTLPVIHDGWDLDVSDPVSEAVTPGVPRFVARLTLWH